MLLFPIFLLYILIYTLTTTTITTKIIIIIIRRRRRRRRTIRTVITVTLLHILNRGTPPAVGKEHVVYNNRLFPIRLGKY